MTEGHLCQKASSRRSNVPEHQCQKPPPILLLPLEADPSLGPYRKWQHTPLSLEWHGPRQEMTLYPLTMWTDKQV